MFNIDIEKIKKYDRPGPRYTSYPTAPHFNESFKHQQYLDEIIKTNAGNSLPDLSLYFHLPFCDTLCYFCGCNMLITRDRERIKKYIKYLKKEIDLICSHINHKRRVTQLHWGGGTPTYLNPDEISDLINYINKNFSFNNNAEQGCEIDPRGLTKEHLKALNKGGFTRVSMGVQDFNEKVQKAVNRIQPEKMTREVIEWIRETGFHSLNIDLMYGLPFQTLSTFSDTIDKIIDLSPDRIAVFNFAHLPKLKKHMSLINSEDLPTPEEKLQIFKMTIEKLTAAGYVFIGMDHFAKPDNELAVALRNKKLYRNFQGYSTHAGTDLYAMGITAISQMQDSYCQNFKTEKEYYTALDNNILPIAKGIKLSDDDILRRYVIMQLMCSFELDIKKTEKEFGICFNKYFSNSINSLNEMIKDDLIVLADDKITITQIGRLLIRNIAMNFDGYIERKEDTTKYSRTV